MPKGKNKRNDGLAGMPDLAKFASGRPPRVGKRPVITPRGPRLYNLGKRANTSLSGPGEPPTDFVTAHTSLDEWYCYWALTKLFDDPPDPRKPPYLGGQFWQYQRPESPTDVGLGVGRVPGGSVSDFVILQPSGKPIIIRIQTERWHIAADPTVQMRDLFIRDHLRGIEKVVEVYSQDFIGDPSGDAVCRVMALAIKGIELPSPIRYRSVLRVRSTP
jgi:hypothetical protein